MSEPEKSISVGRYQLHRKIARGGMATIHIAHLAGDVGFSRIVAAKRLHPELAQDREFVTMFLDEARVASKIHHRNVVPVLDVVTMNDEVILVQDFVHGVPLSWLQKAIVDQGARIPLSIAVSIACQVLAGLHAAHETTDELGTPLQIVHRDVSPQNVMVATDGTARLLDFGVAKAAMSGHVTRAGMFKGKIAYASPEQLRGKATQQSDIYAAAVVLWELLVGRRLNPSSQGQTAQITAIMRGQIPRVVDELAAERAWLGDSWAQLEELQQALDRGLATDARERWATAIDMEAALAAAVTPAPGHEVAAWVKTVGKEFLEGRDKMIAAEEASWRRANAAPARAPTIDLRTASGGAARSGEPDLAIAEEYPRASTTAEQPPISATEPPTSLRPALLQRPSVMIAACAAVGLVLAFGIAFLGRDVDPAPRPATAVRPVTETGEYTVARPQPVAPAAVAKPAPAVTETPAPRPRPAPPPIVRKAPVKQIAVQKPVVRKAAPSPPPPSPPVVRKPAPAAAPSCNPPYYFVGDKKVFKPACV